MRRQRIPTVFVALRAGSTLDFHLRSGATHARSALRAARAACGVACFAVALWVVLPESARAGTIDPRLVPLMSSSGAQPVRVWVTFRDKGARDPRERAALLAQTEAELTPRNRARRIRAQVRPLVDDYDLPVHPAYLAQLAERGFQPHAVSRWLNRAAVHVTGEQLAGVAALPCVAALSPVAVANVDFGPSSSARESDAFTARPNLPSSDLLAIDHGRLEAALQQIGVPALHDSGYTGQGLLACILDAGFSWHDRHEALASKVIAPGHRRDFVDGDTTVTDTTVSFFMTHGTVVMGCLAGNRQGAYVGSGYGLDLALARTENDFSERPVEMLWWGMGAEWADSLGAELISSSLGYFQFDDGIGDYTYEDMNGHTTDISRFAQIAASKGILLVNSVGNYGNQVWHYLVAPSDVHGDSLIAVGSVDGSGVPAGFSSWGPSSDGRIKPDLVAAGVNLPVVSTSRPPSGYNPAAYSTNSGTSLSAPLIAGLAACVMQARPEWTPQQVIAALRASASRAGSPDNKVGYGIPNGRVVLRGPIDAGTGAPHIDLGLEGPNPRGTVDVTIVRFALMGETTGPATGRVRIFDVRGRLVRDLWKGTLEPGVAEQQSWDGRGDDQRKLASGIYWIAIDAGGARTADRVVLLH